MLIQFFMFSNYQQRVAFGFSESGRKYDREINPTDSFFYPPPPNDIKKLQKPEIKKKRDPHKTCACLNELNSTERSYKKKKIGSTENCWTLCVLR